MNILKKKIPKEEIYKEYCKILNGVLQLSNRESEVFSFLLKADSLSKGGDINTKGIRSDIIKSLNISEANLSRYLGVIKEKGLIVRGFNGKWVINDIMRPIIKDGIFELKFILDVN